MKAVVVSKSKTLQEDGEIVALTGWAAQRREVLVTAGVGGRFGWRFRRDTVNWVVAQFRNDSDPCNCGNDICTAGDRITGADTRTPTVLADGCRVFLRSDGATYNGSDARRY